jgi:hypothetical protein
MGALDLDRCQARVPIHPRIPLPSMALLIESCLTDQS